MRFPVVNLGARTPNMGKANYSDKARAALAAACSLAKDFQDLIDSPGRVTNQQLSDLQKPFNDHFDNLIKQGYSGLDVWNDIQDDCGIRLNILRELRPQLYSNPFSNQEIFPYGYVPFSESPTPPPGVTTPGGTGGPGPSGGNPPAPPPVGPTYAPVATGYRPPTVPNPGSTGNAQSYEEQASEYSQKLREAEEARQKSQEEADAQIKASNEARDAAMQAMKDKYESGNPNAVCGPGEWWDGRSCRSVNLNRAGGLVNQAMNFGPSGGTQMVTPGNLDFNPGSIANMGRHFPVINLHR